MRRSCFRMDGALNSCLVYAMYLLREEKEGGVARLGQLRKPEQQVGAKVKHSVETRRGGAGRCG